MLKKSASFEEAYRCRVPLCFAVSLPGFVMASDFEPQTTTVDALAPVLVPYLLAIAVTSAVLIRSRKHRGSAA